MKAQKKSSVKKSGFRPGSGGVCEAQLWSFTGPQRVSDEENIPETVWVAAESLDAALHYVRQRHEDFIITAARFVVWPRFSRAHRWINVVMKLAAWAVVMADHSNVCDGA